MGDFQNLKNQAAVIRDEQLDKKNTALRIGKMFIDMLEQLENVLPDENVQPDTLTVEPTETSYKLKFSTIASDGSIKSREVSLPLASETKAGIMSPALLKGVKDQLTELGEKIPNTNFITCSTLNSVANKTVNILDFKLSNRVRLLIKMVNANAADNANLSISSPQLDTKPLYYNGERASSKNSWEAGAVLDIYYDGANFQATDFQGGADITVDSELSETSANPVQNQVITKTIKEIEGKIDDYVDVKGEYQNGDCWLYGDLSDYNAGIGNHVRYYEIDISEYAGGLLQCKCYFKNPVGSGLVDDLNHVVGRLEESTLTTQEIQIPDTATKLRISNDTSKISTNNVIIRVKKVAKQINVINDLTTGGTKDALSAEMGKNLGTEVYGGYKSIKPETIKYNVSYLENLSKYDFGGTGCNRYDPIDVTKYRGKKIRIKAFVPSGKQVASGFVDSDLGVLTKLEYNTEEYQEFTVSEEATELRLCFSSDKTANVSIEVEQPGLSDRISSLENYKPEFSPIMTVKGLKGKAVGDSITAGSNGGVSYVDKVKDLLRITYENNGYPGDTIRSMTARDLGKVTDADFVTIMGGTNDFSLNAVMGTIEDKSGSGTFYGDLEMSLSTHRSTNPNVPLIYITPCRRYDKTTNTQGLKLDDYVDAIINFCNKHKLLVIDLYNTGLINNSGYCIADKVHLNESGATEIASQIAKMIPYFMMVNRSWIVE